MTTGEKQRLATIERAIRTKQDYSVLNNGGEELVRARASELGITAAALMWTWAGESKSKPAPPRNSPDHVAPRRPATDDVNDDDAPPERSDDDDDEADDAACACECAECRDGHCEDCSNPLCRDPNCKHADSDDDFDE